MQTDENKIRLGVWIFGFHRIVLKLSHISFHVCLLSAIWNSLDPYGFREFRLMREFIE